MHMRPIMSRRRVGERKRPSWTTVVTNINVFVSDFNTDDKNKNISLLSLLQYTHCCRFNKRWRFNHKLVFSNHLCSSLPQAATQTQGWQGDFFFVLVTQLAAWLLATVQKSLKKTHTQTHSLSHAHTHLNYDYTQRGKPMGFCVQGY